MKNFLSKYAGYNVSHSNSYVATAFAVVVTTLLVGGYEVTQTVHDGVAMSTVTQPETVVRLETMVVTAKRG
jgi:hypothetical protein